MTTEKSDGPQYTEGVQTEKSSTAHTIQPSSFPEDEPDYTAEAVIERTVAFFPDSRASTLALAETVQHLVAARSIGKGLVELNTAAGVVIADQLRSQGVAYEVMTFDNAESVEIDELPEALSTLHADAAGHLQVSAEEIQDLDANYVIIPAIHGAGQRRIDLAVDGNVGVDITETTLPGHVAKRLEQKARITKLDQELLYMDVPERGLVQEVDGTYQRRILHLQLTDDSAED